MSGPDLPAVPADGDETGALASELANAYRRMAAFYRDQLELTGPAADVRARGADDTEEEAAADLARIQDSPPDQVSWYDLERLVERDPEAMLDVWRGIKAAAREELATGHRAAAAHDWEGTPWDRAQFLAIRDSFRADYRPRPGIEAALVDMAAEAFATWLQLSERYQRLAGTDAALEEQTLGRDGNCASRITRLPSMRTGSNRQPSAHTCGCCGPSRRCPTCDGRRSTSTMRGR